MKRRVHCERVTERIAEADRTASWCERFYWETMEDHLGVALIQPGDSVIIIMSGFVIDYLTEQAGWNREYIRPMHYLYGSVWGFLFTQFF